jgi:AcrR family transcriptional regulator
MPTLKKNDYHHGNLKEEFLNIAFEFIHKEDVDKLTLKVLSDATGTSRSAIYRHFSSKDALMEEIIRRGFEEFDAITSPTLRNQEVPLVDRFYNTSKIYIAWAKENPNLYRLLFGRKYAYIREEILSIKEETCDAFGALRCAVEEGQEKGILKREDSLRQSVVIWASLHGLSSLIIDGFMDVAELSDELVDDMFRSLLAGIISNKVKIISTIPFVNGLLKPKYN